MKLWILLVFCVGLLACADKTPPPPPTYQAQAPVPRAPAVSPHVEGLREATAQADRASAIREDRGERMITEAQRLREGMRLVAEEADRLREQEVVSDAEIQALWQMFAGQQLIAEALFAEAEHYRVAARVEAAARKTANSKIPPLQAAVEEARRELEAVRLQLEDAEKIAQNATASAEAHHRAVVASASQLEQEKGAKKVWRGLALTFGAIAILGVAFILFRPRFL